MHFSIGIQVGIENDHPHSKLGKLRTGKCLDTLTLILCGQPNKIIVCIQQSKQPLLSLKLLIDKPPMVEVIRPLYALGLLLLGELVPHVTFSWTEYLQVFGALLTRLLFSFLK